MTQERHADLLMHPGDSDQNHPLHRAQIRRRFRYGVYAALGLLLLGAVATISLRINDAHALEDVTAAQSQPHVMTVQASSNSRAEPIILPGTLQGKIETPIYARSAGYVMRWTSDIGTRVKQGDLLVEIATPEIDQQLSQAIAARPQIVSTVALAKSSYVRWQALRKLDAVSQQELDERQSSTVQAEANLAAADANINRLKELKSFQRINAPFSGTITRRNINVGDLIDAGNGGAAKAMFTLAQTDALKVYLYVPQAYAQLVSTGTGVEIRQAELPGQVFSGIVVRNAGAIDAASRTLQIEVNLANTGGKLLAGSYVNVALPTLTRTSLRVPTNSLLLRAEGPRIGVVGADNRVRLHSVTLGVDYGQTIEILSGVTAADQLIVNPSDSLANDDIVVATPSKTKQPKSAKDGKSAVAAKAAA